jgi:hypothetical protein
MRWKLVCGDMEDILKIGNEKIDIFSGIGQFN